MVTTKEKSLDIWAEEMRTKGYNKIVNFTSIPKFMDYCYGKGGYGKLTEENSETLYDPEKSLMYLAHRG